MIIGLDPGLARVGWGVIEVTPAGPVAVAYGCIETDQRLAAARRLHQIAGELATLLTEFTPQMAVVEQLFFARNQKTAMSIAEARGVILAELAAAAIPYLERTPLQLKTAVAGYGGADKKQVQYMVQQLLGLEALPQPDDAADGLALALAGATELDRVVDRAGQTE